MTKLIHISDSAIIQAFHDGYDAGYNDGYAEGGEEASTEIDLLRIKMAQESLDQLINSNKWNEGYYMFRATLRIIAGRSDPLDGDWEAVAKEFISLARASLEIEAGER